MSAATGIDGPLHEAHETAWPRQAYAWYVVVVLLVCYAFAILDRIAIGLLVDPIKADLGVSDTQMGLLQGLAFAVCYTTCGLPVGYMLDRWSRRPLLAAGIALWSAATVACGFAQSFVALFLARIGVGIGEATITPGAGSLIADYFPPERRSKAYGVFMLGSSLGTGFSYLSVALAILVAERVHASGVPWLAALRNWQITFFLIGAPGLLLAALFFLTVREPVRRGRLTPRTGPGAAVGLPLVWGQLRSNGSAYATLMIGAAINLTAIYAALGWQPSLFIRVHHWTAAQVGGSLGVVSITVGMVGAVVGGWTMAALAKRGRRDAPILLTIGHSLTIAILSTASALAPRPELAIAFIACSGISATWSYAAALTGLNQITPNEMRGQITAVFTLFTGLISVTAGAFLVGLLNDLVFHGPRGVAFSLANVYLGCGLAALAVLLLGRAAFGRAVLHAESWQEQS